MERLLADQAENINAMADTHLERMLASLRGLPTESSLEFGSYL
jgi:hypothetical protein